jgi:hypothetical protein
MLFFDQPILKEILKPVSASYTADQHEPELNLLDYFTPPGTTPNLFIPINSFGLITSMRIDTTFCVRYALSENGAQKHFKQSSWSSRGLHLVS